MISELAPIGDKPDSLTQIAFEAIRDAIVRKDLPPGARVSEVALATQLHVSKTPVREALLRLQTIGLVIPDGNRRSRIVEPSERLIEQAYEVRTVLEAAICRIAAGRADAADCAAILEAARNSLKCAKAGDYTGFRHWDAIFHKGTATATHNEQLATLADNALTLTSVLRQRDVPSLGHSVKCGQRHVGIAMAIRQGDSDAAAELSVTHVNEVREMLMNALHT